MGFTDQLNRRTYIDEDGVIRQCGGSDIATIYDLRQDVALLHKLLPAVDAMLEAVTICEETQRKIADTTTNKAKEKAALDECLRLRKATDKLFKLRD